MTSTVLITLDAKIEAQYFSRMVVAVIIPTPAGRKNSDILWVSALVVGRMSSTRTILRSSDAKRRSIPITLPGINPSIKLLIKFPMVRYRKMMKRP